MSGMAAVASAAAAMAGALLLVAGVAKAFDGGGMLPLLRGVVRPAAYP